ncbi:MAG: NAD-dependent epimerase/dehydratase family protein [Planctomycetales bacterium]
MTRLVNEGHDVRVLDNLCTGSLENLAHIDGHFEFIHGDAADPIACTRAVDGVEVAFHQAALASVPRSIERPQDCHRACVTATVNLLDACVKANVRRVVYAGSSSAYGNDPEMPKRENQLPQVLSPCAAAKLASELYLRSLRLVLRHRNRPTSILQHLRTAAGSGQSLLGSDPAFRFRTHQR